jgi:hypothetical protein
MTAARAIALAIAAAFLAEASAVACTMPAGVSAREFYRARQAEIQNAPIVVEGYVVVGKLEAGKPSPRPIARLIPRKTYKGQRKPSYALNYYPSTCHVPFPTNKAKRQKVFLVGRPGSYTIIHVEPLK